MITRYMNDHSSTIGICYIIYYSPVLLVSSNQLLVYVYVPYTINIQRFKVGKMTSLISIDDIQACFQSTQSYVQLVLL